MRVLTLHVFITLVVFECSNYSKKGESQNNRPMLRDNITPTESIKKEDKVTIARSHEQGEIYPIRLAAPIYGIGVLIMKTGQNLMPSKTIKLFNNDMSIYAEWNYSEEFFKIDNEAMPLYSVNAVRLKHDHEFLPRVFFTEYQIIHFEVTANKGAYYEVLVNPDSGSTKRVEIGSSQFEYYTWDEYIKLFYLMYDAVENPLRVFPDDRSEIVYKYNDYFFKAVEVRGDWVKLKCDSDCKQCDIEGLEGWVKWKEDKRILLSIGYIC